MTIFYVTAENAIVSDLLNVKSSRANALGISKAYSIQCVVDECYNPEVAEELWSLHDDAFGKAKKELEENVATARELGHQEDLEFFISELRYIEDYEDYPGDSELLEIAKGSHTFESAFVDLFNVWLTEEVDGAGDFQSYHSAFRVFEEMGRSVTQELGVEIIEGRHPGDDTQVAELKTPISEANMRARRLGIDVKFEPHP